VNNTSFKYMAWFRSFADHEACLITGWGWLVITKIYSTTEMNESKNIWPIPEVLQIFGIIIFVGAELLNQFKIGAYFRNSQVCFQYWTDRKIHFSLWHVELESRKLQYFQNDFIRNQKPILNVLQVPGFSHIY
jgi:hypothetical protein